MDLALAAAVAPVTMAAERTLPVLPALEALLPEGLVRGRAVACDGLAAPALGLSLAVQACREGAWLAVVDLPWLGVEATVEAGIPVERVVRIDTRAAGVAASDDGAGGTGSGRSGNAGAAARARAADDDRWAEVLGAVVDGFDLILTKVPADLPAGLVRRLQTRIRSRGVVLLTVGSGPLSADVTVTATDVRWDGIHQGHGHLQARRVTAQVAGRRVPRTRRTDLWLPAAGGGIDTAVTEPTVLRPRSTSTPAGPGLLPTG